MIRYPHLSVLAHCDIGSVKASGERRCFRLYVSGKISGLKIHVCDDQTVRPS